jgi:predicted nuclease of predicted toxin-antitoxin system
VPRLYANENFPLPVVLALRRLGHDVLTMLDTDRANKRTTDAEVLRFARSEDRAVLTLNRKHFIRLHHQQPDHAGIVVCTVDDQFAQQALRIHAALEKIADVRGQLIRVNRPLE